MSAAARAVVQAVALLHEEGFELLRLWSVGRVERIGQNPDPVTYYTLRLYRAGDAVQAVQDHLVDHVAFSFDYSLTVASIQNGLIHPDFDYTEYGFQDDFFYSPTEVARYLRWDAEHSPWRGSDAAYVNWFRPLAQQAQSGVMPVMQVMGHQPLPPSAHAVMVAPYAPNHEEPLFPLLGRKK